MSDGGGCLHLLAQVFVDGLFWSRVQNGDEVNVAMPERPSFQRVAASVVFWIVLIALTAVALWGLTR